MGSLLSRAAASAAPRASAAAFPPTPTVPTAAPKAAAAVAEAAAAAAAARPSDIPEIEANRGIAELLGKSTIVSSDTSARANVLSKPDVVMPAATQASAVDGEAPRVGIPARDLVGALVLHAKQPQQWTAKALAAKYDMAGQEKTLIEALEHVRPYRVEQDAETGRPRGVPVDARVPSSEAESSSGG